MLSDDQLMCQQALLLGSVGTVREHCRDRLMFPLPTIVITNCPDAVPCNRIFVVLWAET